MKLHELKPTVGARKSKTRVGRGNGSKGTTAGRGYNGQNSRTGGGVRNGFEGGQSTFLKRMPKLGGFRNPNRIEYTPVSLAKLEELFGDKETVSLETLKEKGIIRKSTKYAKILGTGVLSKKLTFQGVSFSATAKTRIEKAGGEIKDDQKTEKAKATK